MFDFNNDGRLDIFITDMHSDMSETIPPEREKLKSDMKWPVSFRGTGRTSIWGNAFFLKEGPGKYKEVSEAIGAENYSEDEFNDRDNGAITLKTSIFRNS